MLDKQKIILIGGATAVGKTELAIRLAKLFDGEIISCDSVQIYKELNIGSNKATGEELSNAKHFLIDIKEPTESYSVAEFKCEAQNLIKDMSTRKKLPIIVGGTGLYMMGLLFPYELGNSEKSVEIRDKYNRLAAEKGNEYVYNLLLNIDPKSAEKLFPNDIKRVVRALEIFEISGKRKSETNAEKISEYDYFLIFLNDDRETLYGRINSRVETMFKMGLEDEVKYLVSKYSLTKESQSMNAIGYKEFFDYFENNIDRTQLIEKIKLNSRHYAKRQITWFKHMPNVKEYNRTQFDQIINDVKFFISKK